MTPDDLVEPFNVVEHICSCLVPGVIDFTRGALGLERREEAFHRCIVPDIVGSAHAADDAAIGHQSLELFAGVLTALIRVMQQLVRLAAPPAIVGAYAGYIAGFALSYYIGDHGDVGSAFIALLTIPVEWPQAPYWVGLVCASLSASDAFVIRWARRKYKRMVHWTKGARDWFDRLRRANPTLFAHWPLCHGNGRTSGAV